MIRDDGVIVICGADSRIVVLIKRKREGRAVTPQTPAPFHVQGDLPQGNHVEDCSKPWKRRHISRYGELRKLQVHSGKDGSERNDQIFRSHRLKETFCRPLNPRGENPAA